MSIHFRRKLQRGRCQLLLLLVLSVIVYNEYLSYVWVSWPHLKCDSGAECITVLLVSDPQILGEQLSMLGPLDAVARWDSDRYLAKTFWRARNHLSPDVIVFLGDMMDEGSIATAEEFARYLRRFVATFRGGGDARVIFVPGDNDIGGEDNDPVLPDIVDRFQDAFSQPDVVKHKGFDFFKVNRLTYGIPKPLDVYFNTTRIIVSHLPLLFLPMPFVKTTVEQIRPQLIFSGHHHKSIRITADVTTGDEKLVKAMLPGEGPIWKFKLNDILVHEIMVPTCSYRMGVADVGYGAAVIDVTSGAMWYSVLWLPGRFPQLLAYLGLATACAVYMGLRLVWGLCCMLLRRR